MPRFISKIWLKYIYVYLYKNPYSEVYIFIDYISVSLHSKDKEGGAKYIFDDDDDNVANIMDVEVWNCLKMLINLFIWLLNVNVKNDVDVQDDVYLRVDIYARGKVDVRSKITLKSITSTQLNSSQLNSSQLYSSQLIASHLNSSYLNSSQLN